MNNKKTKGLSISICPLWFGNLCLVCQNPPKFICEQEGTGKRGEGGEFCSLLCKDNFRNLANEDGYTIAENEFRARNCFGLWLKRNKFKEYNCLLQTLKKKIKILGPKCLDSRDSHPWKSQRCTRRCSFVPRKGNPFWQTGHSERLGYS